MTPVEMARPLAMSPSGKQPVGSASDAAALLPVTSAATSTQVAVVHCDHLLCSQPRDVQFTATNPAMVPVTMRSLTHTHVPLPTRGKRRILSVNGNRSVPRRRSPSRRLPWDTRASLSNHATYWYDNGRDLPSYIPERAIGHSCAGHWPVALLVGQASPPSP